MYPLADSATQNLALSAIRQSHGFAARVEVWETIRTRTLNIPTDPGYIDTTYPGSHNVFGYQPVVVDGVPLKLPILSGDITVDMSSRIRRTLSMTTPNSDDVWNALAPYGVELRVFYSIKMTNARTIDVPVGVFVVDAQSVDYGPAGVMTITANDRWTHVQRADFEQVKQTSGNAVASIIDLVLEAFTSDTSDVLTPMFSIVNGDTGQTVSGEDWSANQASALGVLKTYGTWKFHAPSALWTSNRDDAIYQLSKAASVDVFFDPNGELTIRTFPTLVAGTHPVWRVDAGASGIQLSAQRTRDRSKTFNVICVRPSSSGGTAPFPLVVVEDRDPQSPTFAGGPFGRVVYQYSNSLILTAKQATAAGQILLDRYRALAAQLTLTSIVNPMLDAGDCIGAILPRKRGLSLQVERHIVESLTVPLTADGTQSITTRSTRPADEDDGGLWLATNMTWANVWDATATPPTGDEATWGNVLTDFATWGALLVDARNP